MDMRPSRRGVVTGAAATALTVLLPTAGTAFAHSPDGGRTTARLHALERAHSARLGVFAWDTVTGRTVLHRADELFPMCSTFKTIAVAAVLRDLDRDGEFLAHRIRYTQQDVTASGYAPVTGLPGNLADGMTVADLCAAAVDHSDNTAANLLLRELGGPGAVTRFCRSVGDEVTRLDRWEPELNSAEPGRVTDTSSPRAIGRTYARLTRGGALRPGDAKRLTGWLLGNTTSTDRFRAGLPRDWTVADKTGTGAHGTTNDVGITWPPGRGPIVLAVLSTKDASAAPADEPLVAGAAALLAAELTGTGSAG
ncbi:beta-lactamase [Kitasatospora herbaricolor]|uniref:class A beta-lactamase n=1 Tax=Kitasatospora herbaricolor TaxID=68217 RepID=UPI00174A80DF|nr:class A beta-lactamase [Kitasatospora herbaricolor]MDQ0306941.1 beta-lactamase class A [Kitasatospora herbaricolor]GGV19183.1 beta-lactamase [Kitasatospora herbaricolor]